MSDMEADEHSKSHKRIQALRMVIVPAFLTIPAVMLWHWCYLHGWHSTREADEPIVNAILPGFLVAHVLIVGFVYSRQSVRYDGLTQSMLQLIHDSADEQSKLMFREYVMRTVSLSAKYIIFVAAMIVELWVISLHYELYWTGFAAVFCMGYFLSLMWEWIADFDDPFHGTNRIGLKLPPELMSELMKGVELPHRWSDKLFEHLIGNGNGAPITFTK